MNLPKSIPAKYADRISAYENAKNMSGLPHMVILKPEWHFVGTNGAPRVEYFATVKEMLAALRATVAAPVTDDLVAVASYANGAHVGLSINGQFVLSFPAQLVAGAIPSVDEAEWIMTGAEVRTACDRFNLSRQSRVSLDKAPAPVGVRILADVPHESNAVVMARAVAYVRDIRLTREYLADVDGDVATLDAGISDNEQVRALAAEQARADAARRLAGVDPMATEHCETCGAALESGQIGDCDECQEEPREFVNHYKCPKCAHHWTDTWTAQCDDDCPECGARHVSPFKSEDA